MKKRVSRVAYIVFVILLCLQYGMTAQAISSFTNTNQSNYEANIILIANKLYIVDKEKYCDKLLRQYKENSLPNICISTDLSGKLKRVSFTVYINSIAYKLRYHSFEATYYLDENTGNYILEID